MTMVAHANGRHYVFTWLALLACTALSVLLTGAVPHAFAPAVALVIAAVKATLVALFFMHLAVGRFSMRLALVAAVLFIALLCGLVAVDVASRHTFPAGPYPVHSGRGEDQG